MSKRQAVKLSELQYTPKELSQFWRRYFSKFSIDVTRLLTKYTLQNLTVRFLHRDVFLMREYMQHTSSNSIIQPFKITPHQEIGFFYVTGELVNQIMHLMLGGSDQQQQKVHYLTKFDEKLMVNCLNDLILLAENHLRERDKEIQLIQMDPVDLSLLQVGFEGEHLISTQQFLVMSGSQTHVFDLCFSNKFLESFVLI